MPLGARPSPAAVAVAAVAGAALAAGQLVAARALGMTLWTDYHPYDGPGWYRDVTSALWYPAASVVLASVAAGAVALRRPEAGWGLVCFVVLYPLGRMPPDVWPEAVENVVDLLLLPASLAVVAVAAARAARRAARPGPGLAAGLVGPLLVWSVYAAVGPRAYDHSTQSGPYLLALLTVLLALVVAPVAALVAAVTARSGSSSDATSHGTSTRRSP
ncbi:hypothetical protein Nocox_21390 [Nonomuraea coxensis DSM 45129]|uniref:Uncharacterized protein n=1 Tax=Nonomuraea coxensis DSM 45129 TaxID=1122611 RepID=A0ABX8U2B2_9ACTN|nr:hypothetical protein Nocox_21390 [Nonomuraea coxensis DSM 45129]